MRLSQPRKRSKVIMMEQNASLSSGWSGILRALCKGNENKFIVNKNGKILIRIQHSYKIQQASNKTEIPW